MTDASDELAEFGEKKGAAAGGEVTVRAEQENVTGLEEGEARQDRDNPTG